MNLPVHRMRCIGRQGTTKNTMMNTFFSIYSDFSGKWLSTKGCKKLEEITFATLRSSCNLSALCVPNSTK